MIGHGHSIHFRRFDVSDFRVVQEMHADSFGRLALGHYSADEIAAHNLMFQNNNYLDALSESNITLALDGNKVVGSAGWCHLDQNIGRIRKVFVSPDYAGQGLGRLLVEQVEKEMLVSGINSVVLRASMNSVPFYERLGFLSARQERMDLSELISVPVMMMKKALRNSANEGSV